MKKIVALALALCMVFAIVAVSASAEEDIGDTLVLYSTMTEKDLEALIDGFAEVYPDCEIEVVSGTIGETTSRIAAEADNPQGDVTWGGLADSDGMQYADLFEEWVSDESANAIEGYSTPNGIYSMDHLSTIVFAINTDLEKELGLDIRSYADLLDPKLEGKIIFSNPNSSSAAWNNLCNIMSVFGPNTDEAWDYIGKLMKNLVISDSSSNCFKLVEQGEYVVGLHHALSGRRRIRIRIWHGCHQELQTPCRCKGSGQLGLLRRRLLLHCPVPQNSAYDQQRHCLRREPASRYRGYQMGQA